jgi:hypothetical protein
MRIQKAVGLTLALLVYGYSGQPQNPTAPHPATVRKQVTLVAMLVDFSHSSMLMHFVPVKPSASQLGLKEHQFIVLPLPIEWKALQFESNSPYPDSPRFISPEGKRISPYDLEPGMRVKLKGKLRLQPVEAGSIRTEEVTIEADTVRLLSWKLYLPPARLRGQLIEVESNSCGNVGKLQVGERIVTIRLRRQVQLHGDEPWRQDFERKRLDGLKLGMELEIRGYWFSWSTATAPQEATEGDQVGAQEVLVEEIRIVKDE